MEINRFRKCQELTNRRSRNLLGNLLVVLLVKLRSQSESLLGNHCVNLLKIKFHKGHSDRHILNQNNKLENK